MLRAPGVVACVAAVVAVLAMAPLVSAAVIEDRPVGPTLRTFIVVTLLLAIVIGGAVVVLRRER